jgi:V/A-type H+-transporting ATPase subunit D
MAKLELPPTKSSLRKIKQDLLFAHEGHDLLNEKREILAMESVRRIDAIRRLEDEFRNVLNDLYDAYREAAMDMGSQTLTQKSCSEKKTYTLHFQLTRLMGLKLPAITLTLSPFEPPGSISQTTASYDTAKDRSQKALMILAGYAAVTKEIIVLARELKKVQRRVNALEKIFIPPHEEAQKYITGRIEEMEREEIFVKKLIRKRMTSE